MEDVRPPTSEAEEEGETWMGVMPECFDGEDVPSVRSQETESTPTVKIPEEPLTPPESMTPQRHTSSPIPNPYALDHDYHVTLHVLEEELAALDDQLTTLRAMVTSAQEKTVEAHRQHEQRTKEVKEEEEALQVAVQQAEASLASKQTAIEEARCRVTEAEKVMQSSVEKVEKAQREREKAENRVSPLIKALEQANQAKEVTRTLHVQLGLMEEDLERTTLALRDVEVQLTGSQKARDEELKSEVMALAEVERHRMKMRAFLRENRESELLKLVDTLLPAPFDVHSVAETAHHIEQMHTRIGAKGKELVESYDRLFALKRQRRALLSLSEQMNAHCVFMEDNKKSLQEDVADLKCQLTAANADKTSVEGDLSRVQEENATSQRVLETKCLELDCLRHRVKDTEQFLESLREPLLLSLNVSGNLYCGHSVRVVARYLNCDESTCRFRWLRSDNGENFVRIAGAKDPVYTCTADDVDCFLRAECTALGPEGNQLRRFKTTTAQVEMGPVAVRNITQCVSTGRGEHRVRVRGVPDDDPYDGWRRLVIKKKSLKIFTEDPKLLELRVIYNPWMKVFLDAEDVCVLGVHLDTERQMLMAAENSLARDIIALTIRHMIRLHGSSSRSLAQRFLRSRPSTQVITQSPSFVRAPSDFDVRAKRVQSMDLSAATTEASLLTLLREEERRQNEGSEEPSEKLSEKLSEKPKEKPFPRPKPIRPPPHLHRLSLDARMMQLPVQPAFFPILEFSEGDRLSKKKETKGTPTGRSLEAP